MAALLVCTETIFFDDKETGPVIVREGSLILASNPLLQHQRGAFAPLVLRLDYEPDLDETTVAVQLTGSRYKSGYGHALASVNRVRTEGPAAIF